MFSVRWNQSPQLLFHWLVIPVWADISETLQHIDTHHYYAITFTNTP